MVNQTFIFILVLHFRKGVRVDVLFLMFILITRVVSSTMTKATRLVSWYIVRGIPFFYTLSSKNCYIFTVLHFFLKWKQWLTHRIHVFQFHNIISHIWSRIKPLLIKIDSIALNYLHFGDKKRILSELFLSHGIELWHT